MKNFIFCILIFLSSLICAHLTLFVVAYSYASYAKNIQTNEADVINAPAWLKQTRVEKVTGRIQHKLEWSIRKIKVIWYGTQSDFQKAHSLGPFAIAVTRAVNGDIKMHIGPLVTDRNFDEIFGHELVHVILAQKYKGAVPRWLEEGLANHLSNFKKVDYKWLARQSPISDVKQLAHPTQGSALNVSYLYKASQAFAEMLQKKCDLDNLLRLSVERKMEDYMKTYCEIQDINKAFRDWIQLKSLQ